jgi:hypothetical protein
MDEHKITFETAKLAKEKGFDEIVYNAYNLNGEFGNFYDIVGECPFSDNYGPEYIDYDKLRYAAPTQSLLQRWLREKHNIHVVMKPVMGSKNGYDSYPMLGWDYDIITLLKNSTNSYYMGHPIGYWFTGVIDQGDSLEDNDVNPKKYEDALEDGLFAGLKCVK